ncbi:hypothetical protein [Lactiplantibacillus pentosus]|uniref:Uncharacterized protein n=1 Tax=Lactiplantibacillus pentosus TaxID=1589 RepID=A0AAW8VZT2_LACPE|nr:hypothetical protein [Lactiplantibacillus pentosus]MBU7474934.1 hypothetical protein [Lactiplantibacillus pentosus]MBU7530231.1 hypothetical protein [Lactiplantibacillus pentosus]MCE6032170.1 hypothetical protein [Lactiplantibacillus pentosus]MCT3278737.1 hypothetical protein [Lactiplantibacillus pentosus]MDT6990976.1 hypothetical protein [Lactiplantibacillus pentosus]
MNKKMGIHPCWLAVVISVILCSFGSMLQISADATTNNKNISRNRLSPLFTRPSGNSSFYLHMGSISISVPKQKESLSMIQFQKQDVIRNPNTGHTYVQPENGVITQNNNYFFHDTASFSLTEGIQNEPDSLSSKSNYGENFISKRAYTYRCIWAHGI